MPVTLPSGLEIYNATPHELIFFSYDWEPQEVEVPSDDVISTDSRTVTVGFDKGVELVRTIFTPRVSGVYLLDRIKENYPNALVVGSHVAAQTYVGQVVAPLPWTKGPRGGKKVDRPLMRPDKFTTFQREI